MSFNHTWDICVLMDTCKEKVEPYHSEIYDYKKEKIKEEIEELYAKAIELTVKNGCGLIMPIDMAIDWVSAGSIIDYDGFGYLLDKNGEEIGDMRCSVSFLKKAKENNACFVAWYNK